MMWVRVGRHVMRGLKCCADNEDRDVLVVLALELEKEEWDP